MAIEPDVMMRIQDQIAKYAAEGLTVGEILLGPEEYLSLHSEMFEMQRGISRNDMPPLTRPIHFMGKLVSLMSGPGIRLTVDLHSISHCHAMLIRERCDRASRRQRRGRPGRRDFEPVREGEVNPFIAPIRFRGLTNFVETNLVEMDLNEHTDSERSGTDTGSNAPIREQRSGRPDRALRNRVR